MKTPWLTIPLKDYEGHMAMPDVGQATMLANEFAELLTTYTPASVALVGCAGGNGFGEAEKAGVSRLVGLDINPAFIADARARYATRMKGLELYCTDIEHEIPEMPPVQMVYAALLFEYVDIQRALTNIRRLCSSGGIFAALLQLPKEGTANVTPSPFFTLSELSTIMRLVPPDTFRTTTTQIGFECLSQKLITLNSGKQFSLQVFKRTG